MVSAPLIILEHMANYGEPGCSGVETACSLNPKNNICGYQDVSKISTVSSAAWVGTLTESIQNGYCATAENNCQPSPGRSCHHAE